MMILKVQTFLDSFKALLSKYHFGNERSSEKFTRKSIPVLEIEA
jgi:hypothetical protein